MRDETREWDKPFINWSSKLSNEFVKWLIETYGDKGAHQYLNEFRAVKDVMASVEPKTLLTASAISNAALKILEEELTKSHEYNKSRL